MPVRVRCECGASLSAPDRYAGARGECPRCGRTVTFQPSSATPPTPGSEAITEDEVVTAELATNTSATETPQPPLDAPGPSSPSPARKTADDRATIEAKTFFDPPSTSPAQAEKTKAGWGRRMFEALLDPRSIQWMVILGGGLMVLGLIIWLASLGIFQNPLVVEAAIALGSLSLLAAGWYVVLRTRFRVAGQALTFLACAVLPLNLWYCHSQGILTLDTGLWVASLVCCLLYIATVVVLRDPLFMFAVEVGATLTVMLLLANLSLAGDATAVSLSLMGLAFVSIHAERAFDPKAAIFTRRQYGLPLFWSGHVQLAASLLLLLACQVPGWIEPASRFLSAGWAENALADKFLLAVGLWLAGTYAYVYSDMVVRRIGIYAFLAGFCLVMSQITLIAGFEISSETQIIMLSLTALVVAGLDRSMKTRDARISRTLPWLGLVLSSLPILLGVLLHLRATSRIVESSGWERETGWMFVAAMLVAAIGNRISAWLYDQIHFRTATAYLCFSAGGLIIASAGLLRAAELVEWYQQTPLLMLIPIGYLAAARLWRGRSFEQPLGWVAHAATAVILFHVGVGIIASLETLGAVFRPPAGQLVTRLLGITLIEAAVFYMLAAYVRRKSVNMYFAMLCLCAALWELMGYTGYFAPPFYTMTYALLGFAFLVAARLLGLDRVQLYGLQDQEQTGLRGRGFPVFQGGNAVLLVAFLAAVLQALARLVSQAEVHSLSLTALIVTNCVSAAAIWLVPRSGWRRVYVTSTVALAAVTLLTLNVLIDLNAWQKLEVISVALGLLLLAASYVGRFQEDDRTGEANDLVTVGFWLGSLLSALSLLIAVLYHRAVGTGPSIFDELAILTVTVLMLVTGLSWQVKSTTMIGGGTLTLYLIIMIGSLAYQPQVAVGVYLAIGGAVVFSLGVALSIYRDKLIELPGKIAKHEGVFRVIGWR